jgi:L-amino acid N-acyltransferase YncA
LLAASATGVLVRDVGPDDWPEVVEIYRDGICSGATFATEAPSWEDWDAAHTLRLVAVANGEILGWVALSPVSQRHVYRGVARSGVYVAARARGLGIGRVLMEELVARSEREGIWTIEASVFPENEASLRLHRAVGFRVVGVRERIGERDGVWRDTLLLERRAGAVPSLAPTHPGASGTVAAEGARVRADSVPDARQGLPSS